MRIEIKNDQVKFFINKSSGGCCGENRSEWELLVQYPVKLMLNDLEKAGYIAKRSAYELQPNSIQEQSDASEQIRNIVRSHFGELENRVEGVFKDRNNSG